MYSLGENIRVTVFGQSHSESIGAVIEGLPAGFEIDFERVRTFMRRRAPGRNLMSTQRREADEFEILSGIADGKTCGAPLCMAIKNSDAKSRDYERLKLVPRPGHADFTAYMKYKGFNDIRGGGQFSGRMTAPLCFAGAICIQLLEKQGIYVGAHIDSVHGIKDERFNPVSVDKNTVREASNKDFPVISDAAGEDMKQEIENARLNGDSVGGSIEFAAVGVPCGIGGPLFGGIEGRMSAAMFGIPAVKGIEFGAGFDVCNMYGSENNDEFCVNNGSVQTKTNNHGGILGGITSGMPLIMRIAVKPTPSISKEQCSVNLKTMETENLVITGRHDPCIVHRAVPVVEAVGAIVLADLVKNTER